MTVTTAKNIQEQILSQPNDKVRLLSAKWLDRYLLIINQLSVLINADLRIIRIGSTVKNYIMQLSYNFPYMSYKYVTSAKISRAYGKL